MEHGIGEAEPECDWLPIDYLMAEPVLKEINESGALSKEKIVEVLEKVGFKKGDKLDMTLGQLSGGCWQPTLEAHADDLVIDRRSSELVRASREFCHIKCHI